MVGGATVGELKGRMGATEFNRWRLRLIDMQEKKWEVPEKQDWYLAQIAHEVYLLRYIVMNMFIKPEKQIKPKRERIKDFLISFISKKEVSKEVVTSSWTKQVSETEARAHAAAQSKLRWFGAVGLDASKVKLNGPGSA